MSNSKTDTVLVDGVASTHGQTDRYDGVLCTLGGSQDNIASPADDNPLYNYMGLDWEG